MIVSSLVGLIAGAVVALKVIAPLTKNKVDDKVLERLEALEKLAGGLTPKDPA